MNLTQKKELIESALNEAHDLRFLLSEFLKNSNVKNDSFKVYGKVWTKWDSFIEWDILFYLDVWLSRINKIQELIKEDDLK
jgi:hypothetical protein